MRNTPFPPINNMEITHGNQDNVSCGKTYRLSSAKWIPSSHWKLTCSRHDIAGKLLSWG